VDRRLLPGDDVDGAVSQVRAALADVTPWRIEVERGVFMHPALVDEDAPVVRACAGPGNGCWVTRYPSRIRGPASTQGG
jgi:acetylornithine deacetylase/succinyl-diaminopimelate desuccinylase-like protein